MRAVVVHLLQARPWQWAAARFLPTLMVALMCFLSTTPAWSLTVHDYPSTAVPVTIPTNPNPPGSQMGTAQSSVVVSNIVGEILKVRVSMYITHSYPSDLQIILISPDNTQVTLIDNIGGNNRGGTGAIDNGLGSSRTSGVGVGDALPPAIGRVLFDQTAASISDELVSVNQVDFNNYIKSGTYSPIVGQSLNNFIGKTGTQVNGTWRLVINDQAPADSGTLRSWTLEITEATQHVWTGATSNDWNTESNWLNNNIPNENERNATIVFPDNATRRLPNRLTNGGIRIKSLQIAGGYSLTGAPFSMSDASTILTTAGTGTNNGAAIGIANDVILFGATTLTVITGGALNLTGDLTDPVSVVGSIVKNSAGTAVLSGDNSYDGLTTVSGGILSATTATALGTGGTAGSATSVASGATLLTSATIPTEFLTLVGTGTAGQGALSAAAPVTWGGPITLSSLGSGVGAIGGGTTVTLSSFAVTTGTRELIKLGDGTVALAGAVPATTNLTVNGGTLSATVAQPNVGILAVNGATFTPTANVTINNAISTTGTATLAAGTITLNGTRSLTVSNTVNVASTFANGTLSARGGTVNWQNNNSGGLGIVMNSGVLTGAGTIGNLSLATAKMDATGAFNVAGFTVGANAWLAYRGNTITATGAVSIQDGVLQPFVVSGTVIDLSGANTNTGAFRFYPRSSTVPVDYGGGTGNDVVFAAGGGSTASFTTTSYTVAENAGSVSLAITTLGSMNLVITTAGGQLDPGGDFAELTLNNVIGATTAALTINDDFIEEGTETGQLIIIPLSGGFCAANGQATLTILDNDGDDHKKCGFGTGLTVFLLLGFGLLLNARLRRR